MVTALDANGAAAPEPEHIGRARSVPPRFPSELVCDVLLAGGQTASIRPILPTDGESLLALHRSLSPESQFHRFFGIHPDLSPAEVQRFVNVDYQSRLALVVIVAGELVAVARYDGVSKGDEAEVAFTVRDDLQGQGIATILLEHLAAAAFARGIRRFVAEVQSDNRKMLEVFRHAGFAEETTFEGSTIEVVMGLEPSTQYSSRVAERERLSTKRSLERLLRPRSIAVIGASARPHTIGNALVTNLLTGNFTGSVYPVNPGGASIAGLATFAAVGEIPGVVDLAVVAVPATQVLSVAEECGRKGVAGLVVITAGFGETGTSGAGTEMQLVRIARRHGMRVIGPNCMGVVNTDPAVAMNATFAPSPPVAGPIAFSSQSGGLGIAILGEATTRGLGISTFVSVGNKADVSGNDLLQYWEDDPQTRVILLYLESFGNPRKFARIARRVSRKKPIVAVKSGRSAAGTRGASSHTAALATPDAEVDALFRQAGVIRVDTLEELFDVADLLSHQPLPRGNRIGIVGNAGGPGVLAADACESHGLVVPELSAATQSGLRSFLSSQAAVSNPVDCIASATADDYRRAVEAVLADDGIDAVIVIFTPPLVTEAEDVAKAVSSVAASTDKPVVANFLATEEAMAALQAGGERVPWFAYPESAARALGKVVPYAAWRNEGEPPPLQLSDIDAETARRIVNESLAEEGGGWLGPVEMNRLLSCYGVNSLPTQRVATADEAARAADDLGYPVAIKLDAAGVVHKSDVGGVRLGLMTSDEVHDAASELLGAFEHAAVVVQPMGPAGIELIAGLYEDPAFGPVTVFGLGGTTSEIIGDHGLALVPVSRTDAVKMIDSLRSAPLLHGYRGSPPVNIDSLGDLVCRLSQLAEDLPEVAELDLNPVVATADGYVALDARARVSAPPTNLEGVLERRRLR